MQKALIYCRVSSVRQKIEGHGLESQEHNCKKYAETKNYYVEAVFKDDYTGGGDFWNRPAMSQMLKYMDENPHTNYVIIFDDLKRFARDTVFHLKLRSELKARKATPECLNFNFEDSPEGMFVETILAAQGQLEREQNSRQVTTKMRARVEMGYWTFDYPPGYKNIKDPVHGKLMVRDEPKASIIQEALEGFASGRFDTQEDVRAFLESKGFYHRVKKNVVHSEQVKRLLTRVTYAGYIEHSKWGITRRKGHHEPLISLQTYEKIQLRLSEKEKLPVRADISADFPLRGFVLCAGCETRFTASWAKGRSQKYPYYHCKQKHCAYYGKNTPKQKMEGELFQLLKQMQPQKGLLKLTEAVVQDVWRDRMNNLDRIQKEESTRVKEIGTEISTYVERIGKATNDLLIKNYEDKIEELAWEKQRLESALQNPPSFDVGTASRQVFEFIEKPYSLWEKDDLESKRTCLKLVFNAPLIYNKDSGFGTADLSLLFKLCGESENTHSRLVEMAGVEPASKNEVKKPLPS